jgi:hypothetical protein
MYFTDIVCVRTYISWYTTAQCLASLIYPYVYWRDCIMQCTSNFNGIVVHNLIILPFLTVRYFYQ